MHTFSAKHLRSLRFASFISVLCLMQILAIAQMETATVTGRITDPDGRVVADAEIQAVRVATNTGFSTKTNAQGLYALNGLQPGQYRLTVRKEGFHEIVKADLILQVQDVLEQNFSLQVGSIEESITVTGGTPLVDTENAAVSTVVDRQFAENLPLNGRSFQSLIELTPGVVLTPPSGANSGQFSINGQRASSNYLMVDGVSANFGTTPFTTPGNGPAGTNFGSTVQGGTNGLVSVDALQEFRIQTSTYSPEFGRTPGGQVSVVTRSGTNQFHGTVFDYFRNDVLDANDWFADANHLPKPAERQNDFGATFGGPFLKNRTFFFLSYEGLRLRLPQTGVTTVPDLVARQNAVQTMQPFLNAFPLDPNQPDLGNGIAQFDASFSNTSTLNAVSLRLDQKFRGNLTLFGRYNYSPSELFDRGISGSQALSNIRHSRITIQTGTVGATWMFSSLGANDLRFNYSRADAGSSFSMDSFGGATPPSVSGVLPSLFTTQNASFTFLTIGLTGSWTIGKNAHNLQRQYNLVDSLSVQRGAHALKFGVDYRALPFEFDPSKYSQLAVFLGVPAAEAGFALEGIISANTNATLLFQNLGAFAQDTWRINSQFTLTYGVRWDVDFSPTALQGPSPAAATGFNNLATLALAPSGRPVFRTKYDNFAPRLGLAYLLRQRPSSETVLRGGFGVFYDLATAEVGNGIALNYPYGVGVAPFDPAGIPFPFSPAIAAPPPISPASLATTNTLFVLDPNLDLPYTLQWNAAVEQSLGNDQTLSITYLGSSGHRLVQTELAPNPNPNLFTAQLVLNAGKSSYNALQAQFQRRLSRGLQALASYTWAHSIDTGSASSANLPSNEFAEPLGVASNRGPSDFDIRHAVTAGLTYEIPSPHVNAPVSAILTNWSVENIFQARSAPPVDVSDGNFNEFNGVVADIRPDLAVPRQPLYLYGSNYPGGKAINANAFVNPPIDPTTGNLLRQGDVPRNFLRAFGAWQWNFAVHRDFPVHENVRLQFRAEMFNILNHPNFAPPLAATGQPFFGMSTQMLGTSLQGTGGDGGFSSLYQFGGPRSIQLALKLNF